MMNGKARNTVFDIATFLAIIVHCIANKEHLFVRVMGFTAIGEPICRVTAKIQIHCSVQCRRLRCNTYNVVKSGDEFICVIFKEKSNLLSQPTWVASNTTTFQKVVSIQKNCQEIKDLNSHDSIISSVFMISPVGNPIQVFCDMDTDSGGWTLIQKRFDGSMDFFRDWNSYKNGFGNVRGGEFWLGLDTIQALTEDGDATLRFDLWDGQVYYYMEYYNATISNEADNYRLNYQGFSGTAGDSLVSHKGQMFSTKDRDNDVYHGQCATLYPGAWWYSACLAVSLNGEYGSDEYARGVIWNTITTIRGSLSKTEMKIKRNG